MSEERNRRLMVDLYDAIRILERYTSREEAIGALTQKAYFAYPAPDLIDHVRAFLRHPVNYIRYRNRKRAEER